jgi:hypothetical protein
MSVFAKENNTLVGFEVLTAVIMKIVLFNTTLVSGPNFDGI